MKPSMILRVSFLMILVMSPRSSLAAYIFSYILHNPIPDLESFKGPQNEMLSDQAVLLPETTTVKISSNALIKKTETPSKKEKDPRKDKPKKKRRLKKKHVPSTTTTTTRIPSTDSPLLHPQGLAVRDLT